MPSVKAEAGGYNPTAGLATGSLTLPSGLAVGDPLFLLIAAAGPVALSSVPTGWSQLAGAAMGTGGWLLLTRTGGWQTADGTTLAVTFTTTIVITYSTVGLSKTLYSPGTFTLGTVTTRGSSITTTTAASVGTGASDTLVFSVDKASTHTGAPDAPSVSPTTTLGSWRATSAATTPSTYVGIYSGSAASRTITYTTASGNGAAVELALTAAAPTGSILRGVIASGSEVATSATLRGVIVSGSEVAAGAALRGYMASGVETP